MNRGYYNYYSTPQHDWWNDDFYQNENYEMNDFDDQSYYSPSQQWDPYNNNWLNNYDSDQDQYPEPYGYQDDIDAQNDSFPCDKWYLDQKFEEFMNFMKEVRPKEMLMGDYWGWDKDEADQAEHDKSQQMTMGDYCDLDEDGIDEAEQREEVTLFNNESCEHLVHEPTLVVSETAVEDYVSNDDQDFQIFSQEIIDSAWESLKKMLCESEPNEVGEVATCPTTLIIPSKQSSVDFLGTELKNSNLYKQPIVLINQPILTTIFAKISCHEGIIDVKFGSLNLRLLLSGPTNNPPIMDDLIVINTIDEHDKENTANMLSDNAHDRKRIVSGSRKEEKTASCLKKGTSKRKRLQFDDPKKEIPPYTQHEVKRRRIDGRHTSDPP